MKHPSGARTGVAPRCGTPASSYRSLTSIVLGAQQTIAIPELTTTNHEPLVSEACASDFQRRLKRRESAQKGHLGAGEDAQPKRLTLFVWQTPLMLFTYSVADFLAGLSSVVMSPLVEIGGGWGVEAKGERRAGAGGYGWIDLIAEHVFLMVATL